MVLPSHKSDEQAATPFRAIRLGLLAQDTPPVATLLR